MQNNVIWDMKKLIELFVNYFAVIEEKLLSDTNSHKYQILKTASLLEF